jgi:hypothetical protein
MIATTISNSINENPFSLWFLIISVILLGRSYETHLCTPGGIQHY